MPAGRPKEAPTREPPGRYYCPTCGELLSSHGKTTPALSAANIVRRHIINRTPITQNSL